MSVTDFIEGVEADVARWQAEGLSAPAALNQAWAVALLDLEAEGVLPSGYLRCRALDPGATSSNQGGTSYNQEVTHFDQGGTY